jgi:regulatory protein
VKNPRPKSKPEPGLPWRAAASSSDTPPATEAFRKGIGLQSRREHSRKELGRKLQARGLDVAETRDALDRLAGEGWQSDVRFAEMLVRTRVGAGYGPLHIRAELGTHGLGAEAIAGAFAAAFPHEPLDWPALARDALRRRYAGRPAADRAEILKRAHFLQRRGFDLASIRIATGLDED